MHFLVFISSIVMVLSGIWTLAQLVRFDRHLKVRMEELDIRQCQQIPDSLKEECYQKFPFLGSGFTFFVSMLVFLVSLAL
ncbi:MAG: hypothetical protein JW816_02365 [Candidatus Buchananbacteria bacterium]|nr:hypothetical protein [Candidatus Buchananbacteria bacterium]